MKLKISFDAILRARARSRDGCNSAERNKIVRNRGGKREKRAGNLIVRREQREARITDADSRPRINSAGIPGISGEAGSR